MNNHFPHLYPYDLQLQHTVGTIQSPYKVEIVSSFVLCIVYKNKNTHQQNLFYIRH